MLAKELVLAARSEGGGPSILVLIVRFSAFIVLFTWESSMGHFLEQVPVASSKPAGDAIAIEIETEDTPKRQRYIYKF